MRWTPPEVGGDGYFPRDEKAFWSERNFQMEVASKKLGVCSSRRGCGELETEQKANFQGPERIVYFSFLDFLVPATQLISVPGPIRMPVPFRKPSGVPCKLPGIGRLESLGFLWQQEISQAVLYFFYRQGLLDHWSHWDGTFSDSLLELDLTEEPIESQTCLWLLQPIHLSELWDTVNQLISSVLLLWQAGTSVHSSA